MTAPWWGAAGALAEIALPRTADVVVIGGGILGLATAYHLACNGARPLLLEREGFGAGATGRNGGFLPVGTAGDYDATIARLGRATAQQLLGLTLANRRLADEILVAEGIDCDLRPVGHLHLALSAAEQRANRRLAALLTEDGCLTQHLDRSEAQLRVDTPFGPQVAGGLFFRDTALLHPAKLCTGLAVAAVRRGAVIGKADIRRIDGAGREALVETDRGTIHAGAVVTAVNAWTGTLRPALAALITPVRGQMVAYAPIAPLFHAGMTALTTVTEEYWQQLPDGSIILGGCRAVRTDGDTGQLECVPTDDVQRALDQVLPALFPGIGPLCATHRWAGSMAFTPDRLPVVARWPEGNGWSIGGFSGNGMSLSLIFGRLIGDALLGRGADPRLDIFSPDRFGGASA